MEKKREQDLSVLEAHDSFIPFLTINIRHINHAHIHTDITHV